MREWVPLPTAARALGFDWRTLRKYIVGQDFVRILGTHWYVRYSRLIEWFEQQRPWERQHAPGTVRIVKKRAKGTV